MNGVMSSHDVRLILRAGALILAMGFVLAIAVRPSHTEALPSDGKSESQEEVWKRVETGGWPESLKPFQSRFQSGSSYVALYTKLPRRPIDMRSPDRFRRSMAGSEVFRKSSIGHMAVGWSCQATSSAPRFDGFAAQTGENAGQSVDMLKTGWGLTSLVSTFTDGEIQNGPDIQKYFSDESTGFIQAGKTPDFYFAWVIKVSNGECEQVRDFVRAYVLHPSKPYRNFGMVPDPNKFEGAGCGSFAVAALQKAESLNPVFSTYWRDVSIADKLLGRRTKDFLPNDVRPPVWAKNQAQERSVGLARLVSMNWDHGKIALRLHLVDPELMIFSLRKIGEIADRQTSSRFVQALAPLKRVYNFGSTSGESPGFAEDKDSGYQEIDATFDSSFGAVETAVNEWWRHRETDSNLHLLSFPFGFGVMFETKQK